LTRIGDFACLKCSTTGTWVDFKTQWQQLRSRFKHRISFHFFISAVFHRTNCPKINTPSILLSDEERQIWEQSEAIQDKDTEFIQAILARYGFTEVKLM
jgi:hypothetical protein